MTFEDYQSMSRDAQLTFGISQALAVMATADAVVVTDSAGRHWEVDPQDILPSRKSAEQTENTQTRGFGEDYDPFDSDG